MRDPPPQPMPGHVFGRSCLCCESGLGPVKRDLAEIGRLTAQPIATSIRSRLQPSLDAVRAGGAPLVRGLPDIHRGAVPPRDLDAFDRVVRCLAAEIDAAVAGTAPCELTDQAVDHVLTLASTFEAFAVDLRAYVEEAKVVAEEDAPPPRDTD